MKGNSNFGYKFLFSIVVLVAIVHVGARGFRHPFFYDDPAPEPDTPVNKNDSPKLHFPIYDRTGDPSIDNAPKSFDLQDPSNVKKSVDYDVDDSRYYLTEKIGEQYFRNPTYLTMDEYLKYQAKQDEQNYWKRRLDALTLFNKKPQLPTMYKEGIFDRIFGGTTINVRPQGNVDVTIGGQWQNIQNPMLVQSARKYGIFDFDLQMNISLLATIGDKLKLNISQNTKATFDNQNQQKLEYTGKEDEIIKKIEAGNVSFPLNSTLISGVQSLFGLKTQLQFGKLWVTSVISQQKSKRQSMTVQGGSQTQNFSIKADEYEENRNFLLAHYFRDNYNRALENFPVISSLTTINKLDVWVTNRTGAVEGVREIMAYMDLGEKTPYNNALTGGSTPTALPDNRANNLYDRLLSDPNARLSQNATSLAGTSIGLQQSADFERSTARKLNASEYTFNPQLGYISINTTLNADDILAVAFRFTYNGQVYQVGEFAEDLPPDSTNTKVLFLKLLKGTSARPSLPIWDLMMKNVYALGGFGLSKDDFRLNVLYQDPGGGEKRYIPDDRSPKAGVPLLTILNLDRLNYQNDPQPDGIFDYIDGVTINSQQGKLIFPVLEPFGKDLASVTAGNPQLERLYQYNILYDSTKTIARQFQQNNRYVIKGTYKSASSSEIFLGGFNIPQGSVTVSAGGQKLIENQDYQIDYGLGRIKILNSGILNSGIPVNIQYEDNATFGFQQQNFMGSRFDYYVNDKLTLGGTFMRLKEVPFTQKTTFGEDPIKNTVVGLDANYNSEFPALTRALDKLPIYSTTATSFISGSAEVAGLFPGHPRQINSLDPEGAVYVDDFEGTRSAIDLRLPAQSWSLASTPVGARDGSGNLLFPEATLNDNLDYGKKRAKLAWYIIEPTLLDNVGGTPQFIKDDPDQHYIRLVQLTDVFPQLQTNNALQAGLTTLDLSYFPQERGPYNFDATNITAEGRLQNPRTRWGGIQRAIEYSDFEQSNVEFIEFWVLDPFINKSGSTGGSLYINLGNVSEDVLKDSRKFFENGIPSPKVASQLGSSVWGLIPQLQTQVVRAFDNDPAARTIQDVGLDGMNDEEEKAKYAAYLENARSVLNTTAFAALESDPSSDNYKYFRGAQYDQAGTFIIGRYKNFNNPHGNSPVTSDAQQYSDAATNIPDAEDINRDNTLNESEDYYQYRIDLSPSKLSVGSNYIVASQTTNVKLPNGNIEPETWYQFKVPIREYQQRVGNISDFRSIRFMRVFLNGFEDSTTLRFARLELGRNQWRRYQFSLQSPGEVIPEEDQQNTDFAVSSVSLEENSNRQPIPYVIPPGVDRQQVAASSGQNIQLNEQALSLQVCGLKDGDARAVFKEVGVDMRQFGNLRMFLHAESMVGKAPLKDGDVRAIIRVGSDFISNYYEYQIPLKITAPGARSADDIWPEANRLDLPLDELVQVKANRDNSNASAIVPYSELDSKGNTITVVGRPNLGDAKTIMIGISNPKKTPQTPADDGLDKCAEIWVNELRMTGLNEQAGYAASGKLNIQMADLGSVRLAGSMHTEGYGNIDQKLNQRFRDNFYQYDGSTNLNLGKLMPQNWGVQLPFFAGYSQTVSNPQYDPYDLDVKMKDRLESIDDKGRRDSVRKAAQDYTDITSFNFSNVRFLGNPNKQPKLIMPWSARNFDLSYSYNKQFKRNPLIESDELTTQKLGLGYAYNIKSKPIEPFKKLIKSKSKWFGLIKDFNFNLLPANFTFRTELNRIFNETQVRNVGDDDLYRIDPTYYKNFTWFRDYNLRWELTKSLSFDYHATNQSRIDEPYGRIDTKDKKDSLWNGISSFGRNTYYTQTFNASYNAPLSKLPLTDWTNLRATYSAGYNWTAASLLARSLGNTIGNNQNIQINGELDFKALYNKNRWLKAINAPKVSALKPQKDLRGKSTPVIDGKSNPSFDKSGGRNQGSLAIGSGDVDEPPPSDNKDQKKKDEKKPEEKQPEAQPLTKEQKDSVLFVGYKLDSLSDKQVDSLRKVLVAKEEAKKKAEREKQKRERKLARKAKRNKTPQVNDVARFFGRILTMLKRTTINYSEQSATILPGYMDSTRIMGINTLNGQPDLGFVYGYQPTRTWLETKAMDGKLSTDSIYNGLFQQTYGQNLNILATLEPVPDLRIDMTWTKTFSKSYSELYKDTSDNPGSNYKHLNAYESGSFNVTYIGLNTLFKSERGAFEQFIRNRPIISSRLGQSNPYTNGTTDPNNPDYNKGYTEYSQDVMIPAFIAAYSGKDAKDVALIDNKNTSTKSNPFRYFIPVPNWRLTYNGLSRLPLFSGIVQNLVINHAYTGTLSMNSFVSSLFYQDIFSVGFPSFIDSNSGNYIPFYQVPSVTISEQLNPFIGIDAAFTNNLTAKFEFRKSRTVSLSMIDYQIAETRGTEYVFGLGYRIKGLKLPFSVFGLRTLKNDLNVKMDIGLRDDKSANHYLALNQDVVTRGQRVITISPSIDYIVSEKLTLRLFYDRRQSIPYVSNSFPITTTRAGITLRFIFAQ
ncbi:MAG TPA: cell surface protein SprA [Flavipsychrobacter sp.]|nr:cell surface protein SprA [Flavipsychrobacter sp.]